LQISCAVIDCGDFDIAVLAGVHNDGDAEADLRQVA
jgi:hypothetical protein